MEAVRRWAIDKAGVSDLVALRQRPWSALWRGTRQDGTAAWVKLMHPELTGEIAACELYADSGHCPEVIASDYDERLLALADGGPTLRDDPGDWPTAVASHVAIQVGSTERPTGLVERLDCGQVAEAAGMADATVQRIVELEAELETIGLGEVVCHGDLHPGNALARGGLIDWGDCVMASPAMDLARALEVCDAETADKLRGAVLDAWHEATGYDRGSLMRASRIGEALGGLCGLRVFQAVPEMSEEWSEWAAGRAARIRQLVNSID